MALFQFLLPSLFVCLSVCFCGLSHVGSPLDVFFISKFPHSQKRQKEEKLPVGI